MNKMTLSTILAATLVTSSVNVFAHDNSNVGSNCDMELNDTLTVTPQHLLIKQGDETVIDIYNDSMVFVRGERISLTDDQQAMIEEYSTSIRASVPEVMEIAVEAVEVAFDGINAAFGEFADLSTTKDKFEEIKQSVRDKYESNNGHYTFSEGEFSVNIDDPEVDQAVEEIMEDMMPQVVGSLLSNLGAAISNGDSDFSNFDNMEERIESEIDARADAIELKADAFCQKLKRVDQIESQLVASNIKLMELDLINIKQH